VKDAYRVFIGYLKEQGLKFTSQREAILGLFLETERHVSTDEFYRLVRKKYHRTGYSTVFRTMKHIAGSGIAREVDFGDSIVRYEHKLGHEHHDHLICIKCGRFIEVMSPRIEQLQEDLARKHNFNVVKHKMELFGYCKNCWKKKQ
jgi:Fur family ferric uptake transcriptional regulator